MQKYIVSLAVCLVAMHTIAQPELRGTPNDLAQLLANAPKMVTITGEGEIKIQADRGELMLKIGTDSKSLQESLRLNQELRGKLMDYLKKQGIPSDRIQSATFSSTPKFGWFSEKAKSYHVDNFIKVTVADEKEFQAACGAVDKWPEVEYLSLEFEQANKEELKKQVVQKACDNATEKRKIYEEKFGIRLVPKKFSEGVVMQNVSGPRLYAAGFDTGVEASTIAKSSSANAMVAIGESVSPFGELTYTTQVAVEYSVESK